MRRKDLISRATGKKISLPQPHPLSLGQTVIVLSDIHVPWQDNEALDLALLIARKCSPTRLVLLGDLWDLSGASSWRKNPFLPLLFNQERRLARAVCEIWNEAFPEIRKDALSGNHEARLAWALQALPERFRFLSQVTELDWASLLGLDCETTMAQTRMDASDSEILRLYNEFHTAQSRDDVKDIMPMIESFIMGLRKMPPKKFPSLGWHVWRREPPPWESPFQAWPSQGMLTIGKLAFIHGHEIRMSSLAIHIAVNILRRAKDNIMLGHWHKIGPAFDRNINGNEIGAFLNPCLCSLDQYAFRPAWQQGLSVIDFTHSGHFCVQTILFMRDASAGLFGMLGRNIFRLSDAPVKHRKLPPLGMLAHMLPAPRPEEML